MSWIFVKNVSEYHWKYEEPDDYKKALKTRWINTDNISSIIIYNDTYSSNFQLLLSMNSTEHSRIDLTFESELQLDLFIKKITKEK